MSKKWVCHLGLHIKSSLRQSDLTGMLAEDGRELSDDEVRDVLLADYRAGHEIFVGCDNRRPDGGCAGHEVTDSD